MLKRIKVKENDYKWPCRREQCKVKNISALSLKANFEKFLTELDIQNTDISNYQQDSTKWDSNDLNALVILSIVKFKFDPFNLQAISKSLTTVSVEVNRLTELE